MLRVGGSALVQLLLETLAAAGLGGRGDGDGDEEDDVDVILAGVAAAGAADAVFRPQLPAAATEALLLLRNVCFHAEAKAHVSSNPRCVDALVAAAGAADPGARAAAADALLALVHNGQRVAASLRAGRRPARLRRAAGKAFRAANKVAGADASLPTVFYPRASPRTTPAPRSARRRRRTRRSVWRRWWRCSASAAATAWAKSRRGQHAGGHRRRRPRRRGVLGRARHRAAVGVLIS